MEDHHAEYIFIHPSGERLARERAAVLWHPVGFFQLLCPSERALAVLSRCNVSADVQHVLGQWEWRGFS